MSDFYNLEKTLSQIPIPTQYNDLKGTLKILLDAFLGDKALTRGSFYVLMRIALYIQHETGVDVSYDVIDRIMNFK